MVRNGLGGDDLASHHESLLTANEIALRLGIRVTHLLLVAKCGLLDDLLKVDSKGSVRPDASIWVEANIPEYITRIKECVNPNEPFKSELLIRDKYYATAAGVDLVELKSQILLGEFKDEVRYIRLLSAGHASFWLDRDALLRRKYVPLSFVARSVRLSNATLLNYVEEAKLSPILNTKLYDSAALKEVVRRMINEKSERHFKSATRSMDRPSYYSLLLSGEQKQLIDQYVDFRRNFQLVMYGKVYHPVSTIGDKQKRELANVLTAILCRRLNISYQSLVTGRNNVIKPTGWDPTVWSPFDISREDIANLQTITGWKGSTLSDHIQRLKPFLAYLLMVIDEKCDSGDSQWTQKRDDYERRLRRLFSALAPNERKRSGAFDVDKVFLTRQQILWVYRLIERRYSYRKGLTYKTMWMCGSFLGIRPTELMNMRIHDFKLNNDGSVWTDSDGFGVFNIPDERTKMGKTGSDPAYGISVVPELVRLVNTYLNEVVYSFQKRNVDGWLFRPIPDQPEVSYRRTVTGWISRFRESLTFLDEDEKGRFEFKTSRRSMNNLITMTKININDPKGLKQQWAAQLQMRHKLTGTMGDAHYTQALTKEERKHIINETLNFPWDIDELAKWEQHIGQNSLTIVAGSRNSLNTSNEDDQGNVDEYETEELRTRLKALRDERLHLKSKPKDMDAWTWLAILSDLKKQIDLLEARMRG